MSYSEHDPDELIDQVQKEAAIADEQAKKDKVKAKKDAAKAAELASREEKRNAKLLKDAKDHAAQCWLND